MTDQYPDPFRDDRPDEVRRIRPSGAAPPWYVGLVGGMILVILIITVVLLARGDDQSIDTATSTTLSTAPTLPSTSSSSTTTTAATTATTVTTSASSTTTSTPSTTATSTSSSTTSTQTTVTTTASSTTATTVDPAQYASAVWPEVASSTRYQDPVAAARGFAEEFVGFADPVMGEFQQGDSRSGEVEIRATAEGAVTVAFVRQLGPDDTWWVLGAASENIEVTQPTALDEIQSPLLVVGEALAFEGVVSVELRADGVQGPLAEGTVMGGGGERAPFQGEFQWTDQPDGSGALILYVEDMDDGAVWETSVVRVVFAVE